MRMTWHCGMLLLAAMAGLAGCSHGRSTADIPAVSNFEPARYMGRWHEVARLPNSFEEGMTDAGAWYALLPDGNIAVTNSGSCDGELKSVSGEAHSVFGGDVGQFRVTFYWPFRSTYKIIYLESDYSAAIVTSDTRDYVWILTRNPSIPAHQLFRYISMLEKWGFEVKLLQYPAGAVCNLAK